MIKYYIFGSNKNDNIFNIKNDTYMTFTILNDAVSEYIKLNESSKFVYTWLITDFGIIKQSIFSKPAKYNLADQLLPFFIIGQYNSNTDDIEKCIGNDNTIISSDGFIQEFKDNLSAIKKILYCYDAHISARLYFISDIQYTFKEDHLLNTNVHESTIFDTNYSSKYNLKIIRLKYNNWLPLGLHKDQAKYKMTYEDVNKNKG